MIMYIMYDTWITPSELNVPELPIGWYSSIDAFEDAEHKFPWLSLAEYIELWALKIPETLLYKFI